MNAMVLPPLEATPMTETGNPMELRIVTLESDVRHIRSDISDLKVDVRRLNDKMDVLRTDLDGKIERVRVDLDTKIDGVRIGLDAKLDSLRDSISSAKVWALLLYVAQGATLLGVMAHGFGWLK